MIDRVVSWFSCGAASAVATKLAQASHGHVSIAYTEIAEEHPDNRRFLADCEKWFGANVEILRNEKYNASIYEVFRKERFLVGPSGAKCTTLLKKRMREKFQRSTDLHVFGYTVEESDRLERFMDANNGIQVSAPLIERGLTKGDCLAILARAGIELPAMYRLGYANNNCIGCVKGGAGYWNKIRVDFPATFERMAQTEEMLGRTVCKVGGERVSLRNLPPNAGNYPAEQSIECGIFCELTEGELAGAAV